MSLELGLHFFCGSEQCRRQVRCGRACWQQYLTPWHPLS